MTPTQQADALKRMKQWMNLLWSGEKDMKQETAKQMVQWWSRHADEVPRERWVDGVKTTVMGRDIPKAVRDLTLDLPSKNPNARNGMAHYNLLNIAVRFKAATLTKWALEGGWNPNFYGSLVTPVGQAVYDGDLKSLALMRDFGADLLLELRPEHGTASKPIPDHDLGSTALHRVMAKPDTGKKVEIVRLLVQAYPNPLPTTKMGKTPLDMAIDGVGVSIILEEVARREKAFMTTWANETLPALDARTRARL